VGDAVPRPAVVPAPKLRIYVASSWRNEIQPSIVTRFRQEGFEVYDFKNPPDRTGFGWHRIDPDWPTWSNSEFLRALEHPLSVAGFRSDADALRACDACVLVMPCGRSAHLELGWAIGAGKWSAILLTQQAEPELMVKLADLVTDDLEAIVRALHARGGRR
jgi:hypothetical protein